MFDLNSWEPKLIKETKDFALFEVPDGFVSTSVNVLLITQRLYDLGYQLVHGDYVILCKKRSSA